MTIFRKVSIKDRLPKIDGDYYTDQGLLNFRNDTFWQYVGRAYVKSNSNIEHWLEDIELPSGTDVWKASQLHPNQEKGFVAGVEFIIDKIIL